MWGVDGSGGLRGRPWTRAPCAPGRQARGAPLRRQQRGRRRARRRGLRLRLPRRLDGRRRSGLRHRSPLLSARTVNALQLRRRGSAPGPTPPAPRRAAGCPRARAPPTHDVARGRVALQPQATPLLCGPGQGRLVSASPNPTHGTHERSVDSSSPRVFAATSHRRPVLPALLLAHLPRADRPATTGAPHPPLARAPRAGRASRASRRPAPLTPRRRRSQREPTLLPRPATMKLG